MISWFLKKVRNCIDWWIPPEDFLGLSEAPEREKKDSEGFYPSERLIYSYFDGQEIRQADPMTLRRKLMDVWGDLMAQLATAASPMKAAPQAEDSALANLRKVFEVKPWEEGGLTRNETFDLYSHFMLFLKDEKKNPPPSPTSPDVTPPSPPSTSEESSVTPNTSDSGSTDKENSTDSPVL